MNNKVVEVGGRQISTHAGTLNDNPFVLDAAVASASHGKQLGELRCPVPVAKMADQDAADLKAAMRAITGVEAEVVVVYLNRLGEGERFNFGGQRAGRGFGLGSLRTGRDPVARLIAQHAGHVIGRRRRDDEEVAAVVNLQMAVGDDGGGQVGQGVYKQPQDVLIDQGGGVNRGFDGSDDVGAGGSFVGLERDRIGELR